MRFARIMLKVQLAGMAVGAVGLVYVLGFRVHPHQVGYACLIAACYIIFTGTATFFMQQAWRAQARRAAKAARHHDGEVPTGNTGGLGAPGAPDGLRSQRRVALSATLLGAAMLITFVVLLNHYEGPASDLQSSGVQVEGVVTSLRGQGQAPLNGAVDVRYAYAGQTFDTQIQRDDTSPFYQVGEAVTVTLDPSDPHVATVGGSDNLAPEVVWPLVVLLVLGGGAVFFGLVMLIVIRLARRKARRSIVQADHPA
jgi:hypothetical protein